MTWNNAQTKPEVAGVYLRQYPNSLGVGYSYWDGRFWCIYETSPERAQANDYPSEAFPYLPWAKIEK